MWQQDAIRRLYLDRTLSNEDLDDLYALVKVEHGIADLKKRAPWSLADADLAVPPVPSRIVQIAAIKNLVNVNALAEKQTLPISPTGLTIIYGENGVGKSGYSRVLKHACRARDQGEAILANARNASAVTGPPRAEFDVLIDGVTTQLTWVGGQPAPEELSEIAIFDAHCARAYIDNSGDFAYAPYGLDILEGLVNACNAVKSKATSERTANQPNLALLGSLSTTATKVSVLLKGLSSTTKPADVEVLATLTERDSERHALLTKILSESDPKQRSQALRLRATRFTDLTRRIAAAVDLISDAKICELRNLVEKAQAAKRAAELAAKIFKDTPNQLPGTGGDEWKLLFEAARTFAKTSHAGHAFPHLGSSANCPLCQNVLGDDGQARLIAYDTFVQQAAEQAAKTARGAMAEAYDAMATTSLNLNMDAALTSEIKDTFPDHANLAVRLQTDLHGRWTAALNAATGKETWESIEKLPFDLSPLLEANAKQLQIDAKALEDSINEKNKTAMISELAELEARRKLAEVQSIVLDAIAKLVLATKLQSCVSACLTTGISRKATELSRNMATQEVADALNAELRALNVHELQIAMIPESPGGRTQFKLVLQLPDGVNPSAILSEGEQRAIAIAAFLAEVKLGKGRGGIVFDDPVSSLDHRRRWHVARQLAAEAKQRQVIVLTHDIYFLCVLQQEAEHPDGPAMMTQCIGKGEAGFGVRANRLPFDTLSTKKRVGELKHLHAAVAKSHKAGDEAEVTRLTREAYSHLRMAWERGVEEILFQGTVTRFNEGVSTQMLKSVAVEDSDYAAINIGMSKSSKFSGHDPALAAYLPTPHPDELLVDINNLDAWRLAVEKRKPTVEARRK